MKTRLDRSISFLVGIAVFLSVAAMSATPGFARDAAQTNANGADFRFLPNGNEIPDESYCDQPYTVVLADGTWVCMLTTAPGGESSKGQHVVVTRSTDHGKTWSPLVDIETGDGPHASWVVPLLTPYGRLYALYVYNGDRASFGKAVSHDALHGWYVYRYSDDGGKTWSDRHRVPLRRTACDQTFIDGKLLQMFWGVSKPLIDGDDVFISFSKLGKYIQEMGEGWVFHSDNILTERDPAKIRWELLPEGEHGIRHPDFGSIQEEHIIVPMDRKDSFYCVYRTAMGFPAFSISRDRCRSWSLPEKISFETGRTVHTPRACPMIWKCRNGKYLFWFHNNSSKRFENRNPAWIAGGIERDGRIFWSQPEILLYHETPKGRMSYPDLIEADGKYWITETDKSVGRVHEIDPSLFQTAWDTVAKRVEGRSTEIARNGLVLETTESNGTFPRKAADLNTSRGLSLDFVLDGSALKKGDAIFDNRDANSTGLSLVVGDDGAVVLTMRDKSSADPKNDAVWTSDPGAVKSKTVFLTTIIDAGPKIISFVVNGQIDDGRGERVFGWGRFDQVPGDVGGSETFRLSPAVKKLRIYNRYLRTNEAVGNHFSATAP